MAEDKEHRLSLGKDGADGAKNDGYDVSPVINNIMNYIDESSDKPSAPEKKKKPFDLFFGSKPAEGKPAREPVPETAFEEPQNSEPILGGGSGGVSAQAEAYDEPAQDDGYGYEESVQNDGHGYGYEDEQYDDQPLIGGESTESYTGSVFEQTDNSYGSTAAQGGYGYGEDPGSAPIIGGDFYEDGRDQAVYDEQPVQAAEQQPEMSDKEKADEEYYDELRREQHQPDYVPAENNRGAAFTMRTLDDSDKSKAATVQPEYADPEDADKIAAGIAKLRSGLTVRAVALFFASIFSIFITSANDLELPLAAVFDRTVNPSAYLFTNTILGILSVGLAYSMVINGIKNFFKLKPDSDSLASLNLIAACIAGLATLFDAESLKIQYYHLYTSTAILGMFINTLVKLSVATRAERNFELMRSSGDVYAICHEDEEITAYLTNNKTDGRGEIAIMRKTSFVRDFIKNSYSYDLSDLFAEKTAPMIIGIAVAAAILSRIFDTNAISPLENLFVILASFSGSLALCSSFALTAAVNIPLATAGRRALEKKGALLGYSSAEEFADAGNVLFDAEQLFPKSSIRFSNMKMLGNVPVDYSVMYAASLARAGELFTLPAFEKMLGTLEGLYAVKALASEDGEGISGTIAGRRMLLGSRELMKRSNIEGLPPIGAEENFAGSGCVMYLAVSGRAAAMFVLSPESDEDTGSSLRALIGQGVEVYIRCPDGILTRDYIAQMYGLKADKVHILRPGAERDTSWITKPAESLSASMFCAGGISAFAMLIAEARRVKYAANIAIAIQYGQVILGGIITVLLMLTHKFRLVTPTVAMVFCLVFLGVTLIVQKLRS